jgi:2-dehydro-3-deoxyglucarate aldolase
MTESAASPTTRTDFRSRFLAGEELVGTWLTLGSPAVAEAVAHCGLDWVVIDGEHAPNSPRDVADQLRAVDAARASGSRTEAVVRVAANDPILIKQMLDAGASALLVPNVGSAAEAAAAVGAMNYPGTGIDGVDGVRGVAGLVRAAKYGLDREYIPTAHERVLPILQIESAPGVSDAAAIVRTPGLGGILIGPSDLAASLGHLGEVWHPEVVDAMRRTTDTARAAGIPVGIFAADADAAAEYRTWGVTMIGLHSDVRWLTAGILAAAARTRDTRNTASH